LRSFGQIVVVAVPLLVCSFGGLSAQQNYSRGEIENGSRLYEASCARCHGADGDAISGVNFGVGQYRRASSDSDLVRIIIYGIPNTPMPPGSFSESQAGTIVAYLRSMANPDAREARSGDSIRGKEIFDGKGQCLTCHAVAGAGSPVGPDLTEIGVVRRSGELERSLVEPDAEVRPENRSVRAITRDGATITGRLMNQDSFSIQLLDSTGRLRSLAKSTLREFAVLKTSSMPSYRGTLTSQELADVVAYLRSLKGRP
jgi:putative heme-binding domain-containing protein